MKFSAGDRVQVKRVYDEWLRLFGRRMPPGTVTTAGAKSVTVELDSGQRVPFWPHQLDRLAAS